MGSSYLSVSGFASAFQPNPDIGSAAPQSLGRYGGPASRAKGPRDRQPSSCQERLHQAQLDLATQRWHRTRLGADSLIPDMRPLRDRVLALKGVPVTDEPRPSVGP